MKKCTRKYDTNVTEKQLAKIITITNMHRNGENKKQKT